MSAALPPDEVHVWQWPLDPLPAEVEACWALLTAEEQSQAAAISQVERRRHYLYVRGSLRALLGRYTASAAAQLPLRRSERGKPFLAAPFSHLTFTLTHSGSWLWIALAQACAVGIDLERLRPAPPEQRVRLACRFFHPHECAALSALSSSAVHEAFLACWVRKEACIKCWGGSIAQDCHRFAVSVDPEQPATLLQRPALLHHPLHVLDLPAPTGYRAALAWQGAAPPQVRHFSAAILV
ncbi:MAG: 4'-phosphopantetheinyl transferase superfamily protein [Magnetococcales bacterium]|nr:4'-phosphopantetheinyl transferase superfamily protein [Magnetococcales bacterium]MBF0114390.1 4'-phosphopantetheinyl transferase superfamily protein [Magnetococcales bacterium]